MHHTISTGNKMRDADGARLYSAMFTCVASIYIGLRYFSSNRYRGESDKETRMGKRLNFARILTISIFMLNASEMNYRIIG